jgi:hypothetical protein
VHEIELEVWDFAMSISIEAEQSRKKDEGAQKRQEKKLTSR